MEGANEFVTQRQLKIVTDFYDKRLDLFQQTQKEHTDRVEAELRRLSDLLTKQPAHHANSMESATQLVGLIMDRAGRQPAKGGSISWVTMLLAGAVITFMAIHFLKLPI